jgi:hypothetical protein
MFHLLEAADVVVSDILVDPNAILFAPIDMLSFVDRFFWSHV